MENFSAIIYNDLSPAQIDMISALNLYHVKFIIFGGYALKYHGHNRDTADLDLIVDNDTKNIENIGKALIRLRSSNVDKAKKLLQNTKSKLTWCDVKIITPKSSWDFEGMYSRTIVENYNNLKFYFLCKSDIIELKKDSARDKDKEDLKYLKKL
jgi:hypothetical protein